MKKLKGFQTFWVNRIKHKKNNKKLEQICKSFWVLTK